MIGLTKNLTSIILGPGPVILECRISCPTCKTPIPDRHPAIRGLIINKVNSIRAEIVTVRQQKKTPARDLLINNLVQEIFDLDPEDAEKLLER